MIERFTLEGEQADKFKKNLKKFLIPTAILYVGQLIATFQDPKHVIQVVDLIPSTLTIGGFFQYVMSTLLDYQKKLEESNDNNIG